MLHAIATATKAALVNDDAAPLMVMAMQKMVVEATAQIVQIASLFNTLVHFSDMRDMAGDTPPIEEK